MIRAKLEDILQRKPRKGTRVLSLYFNTGAAGPRGSHRRFEGAFRRMLHSLGHGQDEQERGELARDALRPWRFLLSYEPHAPSLAIFCDESEGLFWAREFSVPIPESAHWETEPYIRPLLEALDEYKRYGVVLADREKARLFVCSLGEIEEKIEIQPQARVRRPRHPGMDRQRSQGRIQRAADDHVRINLRLAIERLAGMAREKRFSRLILAGPSHVTGELRQLLPENLEKLVVATIHLPLRASERQVLKATRELNLSMERKEEGDLVKRLMADAYKSGKAVLGVEGVLDALARCNVRTLIYPEGLSGSGSRCADCGMLRSLTSSSCPRCGGAMRPEPDLTEAVLEAVQRCGGRAEQVHGDVARQLISQGGMGALLSA